MGEVPWCRDGDDEFRQEMEEKENKTQVGLLTVPSLSELKLLASLPASAPS